MNKKISFMLISLIVIITLGTLDVGLVYSFNAKQRKSIFDEESTFTFYDKSVEVYVQARTGTGDSWIRTIGDGEDTIYYDGVTYDIKVKNNTNTKLDNYVIKFTATREWYIDNAWNGSLEFHQFREGNELVQAFKFSEISLDQIELDCVSGYSMVYLKPGDYFYYYPSKEFLEYPLLSKKEGVSGFILYSLNQDEINHSAVTVLNEGLEAEIDYTLHKNLLGQPLFIISFVLLIIWFITLILLIILHVKLRRIILQNIKDQEVIEQVINTFTGFLDAKDSYTNGHSKRVAEYAKHVAKYLGMSEDEVRNIYYIGLMHDCGKIGIPDYILCKPDSLTKEEYEVIKSHTTVGHEILKDFTAIEGIKNGVLYHHERYDGKGYPSGISGEDIPLVARIICVCDSFDAMNTDRCYRKRLKRAKIIEELNTNRGLQFDPKILDIFLELIDSGVIKIND